MTHLKVWTDKLPIPLAVKGSSYPPMYTKLAVTCNHDIQSFFSDDHGNVLVPQVDIDAIKLRFVEIHIPNRLYTAEQAAAAFQ